MSSTVHPFWKWVWRVLIALMISPFILLPLVIITVFILNMICTEPNL